MHPDGIPVYSVVIPVFNEVENLPTLLHRLSPIMEGLGRYEIIFVDDGSIDGSREMLEEFYNNSPDTIRVISFRRNMGKASALDEGFKLAQGELVLMMDADLQDQPEEIPKLLEKLLSDNLDVVSGWKQNRLDPLNKTLPSRVFNGIIQRVFSVALHDVNSGFKIMRRDCTNSLLLYGQLHRYMLVTLASQGFKVGEVPVVHAPRLAGVSKYGSRRFVEGLLDLVTIFFLTRYLQAPLHFFGTLALVFFGLSLLIGTFFLTYHVYALVADFRAAHLAEHPLWLLSPVFFLTAIIFLFFGVLGQMILHIHLYKKGQTHVRCKLT